MKKFCVFLGAAALVALPMGGTASAETTTTSLSALQHIVNDNSGKCLVARGSGESNAVQYGCDYIQGATWADQHWTFMGSNWNNMQVRNGNSGLCLTVRGGDNDAAAVQTTCGGWPDQHWQVGIDSTGLHYTLRNLNSGKCLAVRGSADDTVAIQFDCGYADQWWHSTTV
ncbi:RICIN domain-containing protein [Kitasatospora sp. NPDC001225]